MSLQASDLPKRLPLVGDTNAAGVCTVSFRSQSQVAWQVEQISIEMPTAPVGTVCTLRVNDAFVTFLIPTGDAAAGDPPLPVFPGDVVEIEWTGATPGDQGKALVIYRVARF